MLENVYSNNSDIGSFSRGQPRIKSKVVTIKNSFEKAESC